MSEVEGESKEGIDWKKERGEEGKEVVMVGGDGGNIEEGRCELRKLVAEEGGYDYF
ncbi:hypothetical protein [Staphylococcus warneri]|uniref:hypothetical protein n=1 Tax=Staphylococcus warneri TaxID=1292 RepID=UPI001642CD9E|nr:hypothetical protein [Staphylococcus warneri]